MGDFLQSLMMVAPMKLFVLWLAVVGWRTPKSSRQQIDINETHDEETTT